MKVKIEKTYDLKINDLPRVTLNSFFLVKESLRGRLFPSTN